MRLQRADNLAGNLLYIDPRGKNAFGEEYLSASPFAEGFGSVCEHDNACGYIDRRGKFVIEPRYAEADDFSDGLALVADTEDGPKHFIDKTGKTALSVKSKNVSPFVGGLSVVEENGKMVYITKTGKVLRSAE